MLLFIFDVVYLHLSSFVNVSSFDFQATLPCHLHSTMAYQACEGLHQLWALPPTAFDCLFFFIYREHYGFEWAFFTLRSFLTILAQHAFILEICRASYWSSKHRPGPSVYLIHSIPKSFIHLKFVFIHVNIAKVLVVVKTLTTKYRSAVTLFSSHENI